jgi:hypothetical protein
MKYNRGDIFLDKDTHKLYIFDGNEWWEIVPTCELKKHNLSTK